MYNNTYDTPTNRDASHLKMKNMTCDRLRRKITSKSRWDPECYSSLVRLDETINQQGPWWCSLDYSILIIYFFFWQRNLFPSQCVRFVTFLLTINFSLCLVTKFLRIRLSSVPCWLERRPGCLLVQTHSHLAITTQQHTMGTWRKIAIQQTKPQQELKAAMSSIINHC